MNIEQLIALAECISAQAEDLLEDERMPTDERELRAERVRVACSSAQAMRQYFQERDLEEERSLRTPVPETTTYDQWFTERETYGEPEWSWGVAQDVLGRKTRAMLSDGRAWRARYRQLQEAPTSKLTSAGAVQFRDGTTWRRDGDGSASSRTLAQRFVVIG